MSERYPGYNVLDKWDSPSFDEVTRKVLARRLDGVPGRRFLTVEEWELLETLAAHLIPQQERAEPIPIVPWIDGALADGNGSGSRRTGEPHDAAVWRTGLAAIGNEARRRHGTGFAALEPQMREMLLREVHSGVVSEGWTGVAPKRFLIDFVLKMMTGIYYSHPDAWSEIGFGGHLRFDMGHLGHRYSGGDRVLFGRGDRHAGDAARAECLQGDREASAE